MQKTCLYLYFLFIFIHCYGQDQTKKGLYQQNRVFFNKQSLYVYGAKWVNGSNKNKTEDGYSHNLDFYVSKFDFSGKKEWELIIDKKRDYILSPDLTSSEIYTDEAFFYTLVAFRSFNQEKGTSFINHYLIKFDSLGKIVAEKKLKDSTFYKFSSVAYDTKFIYITLNKNGIVCEKYDYNFNLIESISDPYLIQFFYNSKIIRTGGNLLSVGPVNDITEIKKQIQTKSIPFSPVMSGYAVKKFSKTLSKEIKLTAFPLPFIEEFQNVFWDNNKVYLLMSNISTSNKGKLYFYDEPHNKMSLLTDTFSKFPIYFKNLNVNEYLYVTQLSVFNDLKTNKRIETPEIVYYIKNGKVITQFPLQGFHDNIGKKEFKLSDNKLIIYQVNNYGENIKVKTLNYEKGVFLD